MSILYSVISTITIIYSMYTIFVTSEYLYIELYSYRMQYNFFFRKKFAIPGAIIRSIHNGTTGMCTHATGGVCVA